MKCACGKATKAPPNEKLSHAAIVLCRDCMTAHLAEKRRRLPRPASGLSMKALELVARGARAQRPPPRIREVLVEDLDAPTFVSMSIEDLDELEARR